VQNVMPTRRKYILSIDQGTTGTTSALYDRAGGMVSKAYREFGQIYPQPGWVEHDPQKIWQTVVDTIRALPARRDGEVTAVGITNQRETTVVWDKVTGAPIHNAIVWQCRRTADECERLREHDELFRNKTGLPLDPYFSGTKIKWILKNAKAYDRDNILFGTIDSWLIWKLTGGRVHATDYTNASRTLIFDIRNRCWEPQLCDLLTVPIDILPQVRRSIDDYGVVETIPELAGVPIRGVAGDQQAALFGQACFERGQIKNTYGTGCFVVMNTGDEAVSSRRGLITTLAVAGSGEVSYALEGSIFIAGAAVQWLRDELKILDKASDSEKAAQAVSDNGGVYLVPAFVGLGAPHWDMHARGALVGLTRGSNRNHVIRAALEAMAYQSHDVLTTMESETGVDRKKLAVDGGAAANNFLLQFQADISDRPILRPSVIESTSLGVAYMAGLGSGVWKDSGELVRLKSYEREFLPSVNSERRAALLEGWRQALRKAMA